MNLTGLEALADAIMHHEGWYPGSRANLNRNPGNLRPARAGDVVDALGFRVFPSLVDGYAALLADLTIKVTGHSSHGLTPDSTLNDLFDVYAPRLDKNDPNAYAVAAAQWCTQALERLCTPDTTLRTLCAELF